MIDKQTEKIVKELTKEQIQFIEQITIKDGLKNIQTKIEEKENTEFILPMRKNNKKNINLLNKKNYDVPREY